MGAGHPLLHPAALHHLRPPAGSPPDHPSHHGSTNPILSKPRIWSLAELASKESKDSDRIENSGGPPTGLYPAHQHNSPGKIISPLAARIPNYPYVRPDLYRGFYGSPMGGPSAEFLEHQRQFGALAAHNGLAGAMNPLLWKAAVAGAGGPPFAPLSLTTNHNNNTAPQSGASPSASSTSSSSVGGDHPITVAAPTTTPTSTHHHHQSHHHQGPISGNSTNSSSSSSSGKLSPAISVTSTPSKP